MEHSVSPCAPDYFGPAHDAAVGAAKTARLRYVNDQRPGIVRERNDTGFVYRDPSGDTINDRDELARINAIAVPPAWTQVWICPDPNGHIQATGCDARGRKQYRYHTRWRSVRDESKFEHTLVFGRSLPAIRRQVDIDLAKADLPREKVVAAVVRLMERTLARVGNPEYARQNESFGLTTLRNHHIRVKGGTIELDFRAKSGVRHRSIVSDRKLARIVKRIRDLPGSEVFQYIDNDGKRHSIDSGDVNEYLRAVSGQEITAKDFRTWAGTNLAVLGLHKLNEVKPTKTGSLQVVKQVAKQLGNTPAVCRKCYIHPAVLESYLTGSLQLKRTNASENPSEDQKLGMWAIERELIRFLEDHRRENRPRTTLKATLRASLSAAKSRRRRAARG
jgi:DNA topoisomerase I